MVHSNHIERSDVGERISNKQAKFVIETIHKQCAVFIMYYTYTKCIIRFLQALKILNSFLRQFVIRKKNVFIPGAL